MKRSFKFSNFLIFLLKVDFFQSKLTAVRTDFDAVTSDLVVAKQKLANITLTGDNNAQAKDEDNANDSHQKQKQISDSIKFTGTYKLDAIPQFHSINITVSSLINS